jgi:hypothetical protein
MGAFNRSIVVINNLRRLTFLETADVVASDYISRRSFAAIDTVYVNSNVFYLGLCGIEREVKRNILWKYVSPQFTFSRRLFVLKRSIGRIGALLRLPPRLTGIDDGEGQGTQANSVEAQLPDREVNDVFVGDRRPNLGWQLLSGALVALVAIALGGLAGYLTASGDLERLRDSKRKDADNKHHKDAAP